MKSARSNPAVLLGVWPFLQNAHALTLHHLAIMIIMQCMQALLCAEAVAGFCITATSRAACCTALHVCCATVVFAATLLLGAVHLHAWRVSTMTADCKPAQQPRHINILSTTRLLPCACCCAHRLTAPLDACTAVNSSSSFSGGKLLLVTLAACSMALNCGKVILWMASIGVDASQVYSRNSICRAPARQQQEMWFLKFLQLVGPAGANLQPLRF